MDAVLERWSADQRALARALGLTIEEWIAALEAAGDRRSAVTAAAIGAATKAGLKAEALAPFDPAELVKRARTLIDPRPPRVSNPLLKEAIRRADELGVGLGAKRLRRPQETRRTEDIPRPRRGDSSLGPSARSSTADAPGDEESS